MNNPDLTLYFVIDRRKGISFDVISQGEHSLRAISNKATVTSPYRINLPRLIKGLAERCYRLIRKMQPQQVMVRGVAQWINVDEPRKPMLP